MRSGDLRLGLEDYSFKAKDLGAGPGAVPNETLSLKS